MSDASHADETAASCLCVLVVEDHPKVALYVQRMIRQALHPREVVLNDALWREWIDQVADVPFRIDGTYDPLLPLDDLRMSEEQLANIPLGDDQHMYIVGRGPVYRLYEWAGNYVFIAEVS